MRTRSLFLVLLLSGCGGNSPTRGTTSTTSRGMPAAPLVCTPKDLNDNPDKYVGQEVRLTGTPRNIENDGEIMFMEGKPGYKVFAHPGRRVAEGQPVTLMGTVRKHGAPPFMKLEIENARVAP